MARRGTSGIAAPARCSRDWRFWPEAVGVAGVDFQTQEVAGSIVADAFSVDPDVLVDALQRMREFIQHTEKVVAEVNSLVTQLHETWSGQAATAHAEAHRHWSHGEATMREALTHLQTAGNRCPSQLHRRDSSEYAHVVVS